MKGEMSKIYRLVIADDHTIIREGLRALLSSTPGLEVVGEAADGQEAVRLVEKTKPHMILVDLSMPRMSGVDAIREIKKRCPDTKILVLTAHKDDLFIEEALKAGANGYVLKDSPHAELDLAIRSVLEGKYFVSPAISRKFIDFYVNGKKPIKRPASWDILTHRERGILKLVAEGYQNKETAAFLGISPKTVEKHRANLMEKLGVHNVSDLTALATEMGLITR